MGSPARRDAKLAESLSTWFASSARALPWRTTPREPYRSLVSEAMLQQTQVSRVVEKFEAFVDRFPDVRTLADADEHDVLAAWSGLGYYRRARHLHAAARAIVVHHAGRVPAEPSALRALPGVGRYTAGAIASIVFGKPEPLVDGNVRRVLMRVEGKDLDDRQGERWAWERAAELVAAAADPGAFNEGLMELGATVCTPKSPFCAACPWRRTCRARAEERQEEIPRPKKRAAVREMHHGVVVVRDREGRLLVEQRPEGGLWAGMWQAPALESVKGVPRAVQVRALVGVRQMTLRERFTHRTTHRTVHFVVWDGHGASRGATDGRRWVEPERLTTMALANPHRRILLGENLVKGGRGRLEGGRG